MTTQTARIKLRNDNGPTGELSEPVEVVEHNGKYYRLDQIQSVPPLLAEQLVFNVEFESKLPKGDKTFSDEYWRDAC